MASQKLMFINLIKENFAKILILVLIFGALGGSAKLVLEIIFIGIPMIAAGWVYIIFMMSTFKNAGWVVPVAGLTCMGPAYLGGKIGHEILQAIMNI